MVNMGMKMKNIRVSTRKKALHFIIRISIEYIRKKMHAMKEYQTFSRFFGKLSLSKGRNETVTTSYRQRKRKLHMQEFHFTHKTKKLVPSWDAFWK